MSLSIDKSDNPHPHPIPNIHTDRQTDRVVGKGKCMDSGCLVGIHDSIITSKSFV